MAGEEVVFRCPCCGMVAPTERLNGEGPFPFEQTIRTFGGKTKLTEAEREWRTRESLGRGSAHGKIDYQPWEEPDPNIKQAFIDRLEEVQGELSS